MLYVNTSNQTALVETKSALRGQRQLIPGVVLEGTYGSMSIQEQLTGLIIVNERHSPQRY